MKKNYENYSKSKLLRLYKKRNFRLKELSDLSKLLNKYKIETNVVTKNIIIDKIVEEEVEIKKILNYIDKREDKSDFDKRYYKYNREKELKKELKW